MTIRTNPLAPRLPLEDRLLLLQLARQALVARLEGRPRPGSQGGSPVVREPFATFVTLRETDSGELRGCRGETRPRQPLLDSVMEMVVASALGDPRFEPVRRHEVDGLSISISVLSELRPIEPDEVEVGRHGLMIIKGGRAGLLLPSVPVTCGWDRARFLDGLCLKAGLPPSVLSEGECELLCFETVSWGEDDPDG